MRHKGDTILQTNTIDEAKNTAPAPKPSRAQRRATMRATNNRMIADRQQLIEAIHALQKSNQAMNIMLIWISSITGVAELKDTPEQRQERNDADRLHARIVQLVELEKRVKEKEERENPMLTLKVGDVP